MSDEELKRLLDEHAAVTRGHFEAVAERLEKKIDTIAEGVTTVNERVGRLDAKGDQFSSEMKDEFSNVRSMIKFSHSELDRRIRTLEEGLADLQARVERLETSTH